MARKRPTDGYTTGRLFLSYAFNRGGVLNTITARLENAGNTLYRNHLNYLKDLLPEIGRCFKLVYTLGFCAQSTQQRCTRAIKPLHRSRSLSEPPFAAKGDACFERIRRSPAPRC